MFRRFMFILGFLPIVVFAEDFMETHSLENPIETHTNRFYVQPEYFFAKKVALPGVGVGYRFHNEQIGFDASVHGFPVSVCGSRGVLPFLRGLFLYYPSGQGLYLGGGVDAGIITGPLLTMGYEPLQKDRVFVFFQLDGCYAITFNQPVASLAVGFGF